jgi:hypothetical protein
VSNTQAAGRKGMAMARMRLSAEIELYALIWESSRKWKLYNHE